MSFNAIICGVSINELSHEVKEAANDLKVTL